MLVFSLCWAPQHPSPSQYSQREESLPPSSLLWFPSAAVQLLGRALQLLLITQTSLVSPPLGLKDRSWPVSQLPYLPVMSHQLSAVAVLLVTLAVILQDGHQVKVFAEARDSLHPPATMTSPATATPLLQPTKPVPAEPSVMRSRGAHTSSQTAGETSENPTHTIKALTTTQHPTAQSPSTHTLATPNNSHTVTPLTEATVGPSSTPHSQPPLSSPTSLPRTSPSPVSLTTRKTTQPRGQDTLSKAWSTTPYKSTTSQKPPTTHTHTPGTSVATHNGTQTASPASTVPVPTLAPEPSPAKTGIYQVLNGSSLCIKAEMGMQLIIQETRSVFSPPGYFNIDPSTTKASGNCGFRKSNLLLSFPGGFVNLTFTKEENSYYISELGAHLTLSNPEKAFQGLKSSMVLFETVAGHSFQCVSAQITPLSPQLQLKTRNVQLQAFDFEGDRFGNATECFSDRSRRKTPVAVGLSVAGLLVILLMACLVARQRPGGGYERV